VAEIIRKLGISEQTFYPWKKRLAEFGIAELRRLRTLGKKNTKLKQLVADLSLDKKMLQDVLSEKTAARVQACFGAGCACGVSRCRASGLPCFGVSRTTYRYRSRRDPRAELGIQLRDLAQVTHWEA
jgi:putative transposase